MIWDLKLSYCEGILPKTYNLFQPYKLDVQAKVLGEVEAGKWQ